MDNADNATVSRSSVARDRALKLELLALVLCFVCPQIVTGFAYPHIIHSKDGGAGSAASLLDGLAYLAILSLVVWVSGDGLAAFGARRFLAVRDVSLGILGAGLFVLPRQMYLALRHAQGMELLLKAQRSQFFEKPLLSLFVVVSVLISSTWQELLFRGVMIPRLTELTGRSWVAVLAAGALFASVHLYQGAQWLPFHFAFGVIAGIMYVRTGSIWPGVVMHTINNLAVVYGF